MKAGTPNYQSFDEYLAGSPKEVHTILKKIRQTIRKAAPSATELISYRMPAFKQDGKVLAYYAAFKNHIGFFPPVPKAIAREVSRYAGPKGNLRFPLDEPIPLDLIRRIVEYKVNEIKKAVTKKQAGY